MKKNNYAMKGSLRRVMAFLLIFVMLFTSEGMRVFASQEDQNDHVAVEDAQPEESDQSTYIDDGDMQIESTDSIGAMLLGDIEEKKEEAETNGCAVFSAEVSDNKAILDFQTIYDCTLIVAIYDDSGEKLITSSKADVTSEDESITVTFEEELPEYFYLRAYLVDDDLAPLSEVYDCPLYTEGMQEFLSKTTDDFAEDNVLNLDDDETNNFLVYREGVIRIKENESSISLEYQNDDEMYYEFDDPLNELSTIEGDMVLSYEMNNNTTLIIYVDSIGRYDDTVWIEGRQVEEDDIFSYVKIDSSAYADIANVDNSELEDGIYYIDSDDEDSDECDEEFNGCLSSCSEPASNVDLDYSRSNIFKYQIEKKIIDKDSEHSEMEVKLTGTVSLTCDFSIKFYFDLAPWNWGGNYCEVKLKCEVGIKGAISGKGEGKWKLGKIKISPIAGVNTTFSPYFVFGASGELSFSVKIKSTIGFRWGVGAGFENLCSSPKLECEIKLEGTVFTGIELKPEIEIVSDKVGVAGITAEVVGEIHGEVTSKKDSDRLHTCKYCINGDIQIRAKFAFTGAFILKKFKFEIKLAEVKFKIGDWYYSSDHNEWGWGKSCPHELFKTTYCVVDSKGKGIEGAVILATTNDSMSVIDDKGGIACITEITTDQNGKATVYQAEGTHNVCVMKEGYSDTNEKYRIKGAIRNVRIVLPTVIEKETGNRQENDTSIIDDPDEYNLSKSLRNPIKNEDGSVTYSTVYFGNYWQNDTNEDGKADENDDKEPIRWRVLEVAGDDIFLLSEKNIDFVKYAEEYGFGEIGIATWETSTIRGWLNGYDMVFRGVKCDYSDNGFITNAFSNAEMACIKDSIIINNNTNEYYTDTDAGNDTIDKVFLLSAEEATNTKYGFIKNKRGCDAFRLGSNTQFVKDKIESGKDYKAWWLRSPGASSTMALHVEGDGNPRRTGWIDEYGTHTTERDGVRPAIHIKKSSTLYSLGSELTVPEFDFSNYEMEEQSMEESKAADMSVAVFALGTNTVGTNTTAYFTGLDSDRLYNLYVLKKEFSDNILGTENLLYIYQGHSGVDGKMIIKCKPKEISENAAVFVVGMKNMESSETTDSENPTDPTNPTDPSDTDTPESNTIALTGISIDKKTAELLEGETLTLNLSFTPEDATNKNVTWSSSDASIATVADGVVTAVKEGKATIKAVSEDGNHEAICEVTVKAKEGPLGPDKPDLSKYTASGNEIAVKSINLKKTYFKGVKGIKKFEITSGDAASVKIKSSTLTVLKDGTVTVTAFNKKKEKLAEKTLTLIAPAIDTTLQTEISRRGNLDLNKYISSTVKPAKWKSSSKKIAEVSPDGLLTIKKSGKVKITVTFPAEKGMKAKTLTIKLNIKMPQFKKTTYTVKVGKTVSTAVKNASAADIAYKIENPAIATVDAYGKVTGVSKGTTKLIMTVKGIDYETKIKVK